MNLAAILAVGGGAFLGAIVRWLLGIALNPLLPNLPLGTLAANIGGGFLAGVAMALFAHYDSLPLTLRLALVTGFLGGLTTFSSFSLETVALILREQYGWVAGILFAHVAGAILATLAGLAMMRLLLRA